MSVTDFERPHHDQTATVAHRNPINGYRLFRKADLEALLKKVARSGRQRGTHRGAL